MDFTNQASLSYGNRSALSNMVTGTLLPSVTMTKTALSPDYLPQGHVFYQVVIVNFSAVAYPQTTLLDNFGRYDWPPLWRFPLRYLDGTVGLSVVTAQGVSTGTVDINADTDGMLFTFDIPANAVLFLTYGAQVWPYAPLAVGSTINNLATLQLPEPLTAAATLPAAQALDLRITKTAPDLGGAIGAPLSYDITVSNYGNIAMTPADDITISDLVQPYLTAVTVSAGGVPWTQGVQYTYDAATGLFTTLPGAFLLGAATFSQSSYGVWSTTPSALTVTITGTPSGTAAPQAAVTVLPAYTDGREQQLTVTPVSNTVFDLASTGSVVPLFHVATRPDSPLTLLPASHPQFSLDGNFLTVNGTATGTTAYVQADYGGGFTIQLNY